MPTVLIWVLHWTRSAKCPYALRATGIGIKKVHHIVMKNYWTLDFNEKHLNIYCNGQIRVLKEIFRKFQKLALLTFSYWFKLKKKKIRNSSVTSFSIECTVNKSEFAQEFI